MLSVLLDKGQNLVCVISLFSSSAWSSSSYIGIQEVLIGQIDAAENQMFFGPFQLFVLPASPPLESLPQQRAWKRSFFNCQFNLPPSVQGNYICVIFKTSGILNELVKDGSPSGKSAL